MNRNMGLAALVVATILCANSFAASWTPPIGIRMPPFGIDEVAPPRPNPWTTSTAGFYYADGSALNATDSGNIYGTPGLLRKTVPTRLPAGSVVELQGVYTFDHASPRDIVASGTAARPVFIRGVSATAGRGENLNEPAQGSLRTGAVRPSLTRQASMVLSAGPPGEHPRYAVSP